MITTTLPVGQLFTILEQYEKLKFIPEQEQFINSDLKIKDENNNWIDINAAITKNATGIRVTFSNGDVLKGARKHLIYTGKECVFLESLAVGDKIIKADSTVIYVSDISSTTSTLFYDLSVESETHLYQTANGIVHHNTELAKLLSSNLNMKLIRFDGGEFQEKHSVAKLIGSPPGYVGYEDGNAGGGLLVNEIEKNPNSIILFDEIEKAHPDVSNILLSLMDEGMITSSNGKKADARNTIIILTSNLGAMENEKNAIGFGRSLQRTGEDDKAVKDFFKPEFRNRLDGICKFNRLDHDTIRKVVTKFIGEVNELLCDKHLTVQLTDAAAEYLVKEGFDPKMGARPMARKINSWIKVPLSKKILFENIPTGSSITVDIKDDLAVFLVAEPAIPVVPNSEPLIDDNGFITVPTV